MGESLEAHTPASPCILVGFHRLVGIFKTKEKKDYICQEVFSTLLKRSRVTAVNGTFSSRKGEF